MPNRPERFLADAQENGTPDALQAWSEAQLQLQAEVAQLQARPKKYVPPAEVVTDLPVSPPAGTEPPSVFLPPPSVVEVSDGGPGALVVSWSAVEGASSYDVERDGTVVVPGVSSPWTDAGLEYGSEHTYRVRSVNAYGPGEWSVSVSGVARAPRADELPPVSGVRVVPGPAAGSLVVSWDPVDYAYSYDVERDGVLLVSGWWNTSLRDTTAGIGVERVYRVRGVGVYGTGPWSDPVSGVYVSPEPLPQPPDAPFAGYSEGARKVVNLSWGMVDYDVFCDGDDALFVIPDGAPPGGIPVDLGPFTQVRVWASIASTQGDRASRIGAQYSTDGGQSWQWIAGDDASCILSAAATGVAKSAWFELAPAARGDVRVRMVGFGVAAGFWFEAHGFGVQFR